MNYLYSRAVSLMYYLLKKGLEPDEAISIVYDKYKNSKINQDKLKRVLESECKNYFKYEKGIYE